MDDAENQDHLAVAELPRSGLQVVAAVTTNVCEEARRRHQCATTAAEVLSEAMTAAVLLAATVEAADRLTLQWLGNGPVRGVIADATSDGTVRGYVQNATVRFHGSGGRVAALGSGGVLNAVRELDGRRSQGSIERAGGTIADDVVAYLAQTEKRPSAVLLDVLVDRRGGIAGAVGVLVQPARRGPREGASSGDVDDQQLAVAAARAAFDQAGLGRILKTWGTAPLRAASVAAKLLAPLASQLHAVQQRPVSFGCRCSRDKVVVMLGALGTQELAEMIEKDGRGEVVCEFCAKKYDFTREELLTIIKTLVTGKSN
jgi:molecular chaperone Hsp33